MSIGIEAEVTNHDLAFVWNMGGDSGDELQIIHPLLFLTFFPIPVAHLTLLLLEGEPLERKKRTPIRRPPIRRIMCLPTFSHILSCALGSSVKVSISVAK
jgi:hypothetical protein